MWMAWRRITAIRPKRGGIHERADYAPRRAKAQLAAVERDAEPVIEPAVDEPVAPPAPKLTCREQIIAVTEGIAHAFTLHDVYAALPDLSENGIRTVFSRMCHGANREFFPRGNGTYVTASVAAREAHPGTAMLAEVYRTRPEHSDESSAYADSLPSDAPSAEASFSLHRAGLHIEISGDALAVIQSVAGIQQALEERA